MRKLLSIVSILMMAIPTLAKANQINSQRGNYRLGKEMLEDLTAIPEQRHQNLQCWKRRNNPNRDLCMIETDRLNTAQWNERQYNGSLHFVKRAINADINERENRMSALSCHRNNSNRDLCRYERVVVSELNNIFLPEINRAIRNDRARDRRNPRDRARERERERRRRERERERERRRRRGGGRR